MIPLLATAWLLIIAVALLLIGGELGDRNHPWLGGLFITGSISSYLLAISI